MRVGTFAFKHKRVHRICKIEFIFACRIAFANRIIRKTHKPSDKGSGTRAVPLNYQSMEKAEPSAKSTRVHIFCCLHKFHSNFFVRLQQKNSKLANQLDFALQATLNRFWAITLVYWKSLPTHSSHFPSSTFFPVSFVRRSSAKAKARREAQFLQREQRNAF